MINLTPIIIIIITNFNKRKINVENKKGAPVRARLSLIAEERVVTSAGSFS